jgi:hypothetical protein
MRQALSIRYELQRACGLEGEAENVERSGRLIRNLQVHVPPTLTATCQLQELSLKAGRNTYIWPTPVLRGKQYRVTAIGKS